ncbi:MAG TPA: HD family phosphohydrolase [Bacillota bacterium]|nr:HD family phosphohydrolase [Bacillota bacterium]
MKKGLPHQMWSIPESWNTSRVVRIVLFLILGVGIYLHLLENVIPKTYDLQRNTVSNVTITAPMEVEDTEATNRLREEAVAAVKPVYAMQDSITKNQIKVLDHIFRRITEVRMEQDKAESTQKSQTPNASTGTERSQAPTKSPEQLNRDLKEDIPYQLSDETINTLLKQTPESLATVKTISSNAVTAIMLEGVRLNASVSDTQERVEKQLSSVDLESRAQKAVRELVLASIVPNIVYDEDATEQAKEKVTRTVKPVLIHKGELLVGEGEYITDDIFRKLGVAGLLTHHPNYFPYLGLAIFVFMSVFFFYHYISRSKLEIKTNNRYLLMFIIIILLNLLAMKIVGLGQHLGYSFVGYLAPAAFGTMLISLFINLRLALFTGVLLSICASLIFNGDSTPFDFRYGFVVLAGSIAGAYSLGRATHRRNILLSGFAIVVANILAISTVYFLFYSVKWQDLSRLYGYAVASGLLSAVLTIGLIPFFESAFGILSTLKLVELSNPNHPLLRRLLMETPGTYHHSIMVGNLSEAAAEAIGANGLLARVGSYYHDVGKMKRPHFYIENQMGRDNPHDRIAPSLSRTIIISHPSDGVKMLQEHKIPIPIQDIAAQHHGTTLLKYFYHKAMKDSTVPVLESEYRYPGPKAQFKEAAIVGICDSIEAAVRSISKPTPDKIETLVHKIVKDRIDDGQLNECDLTLQELDVISKIVCETLKGIFHNRIEYPEDIEVKQA